MSRSILSSLYPKNTASRRMLSMDGMWKIRFDREGTGDVSGFQNGFDSEDRIPVPCSYSDLYTEKEIREFAGNAWYETELFVPGEWKEKRIALRFAAVAHRAAVYVNGELAGIHEGGFLPFTFDISDMITYDEKNIVVVCANNELSQTTLPIGQTTHLKSGTKAVIPYFDFFNYSGIQRPIKLLALPKCFLRDYSLTYEITGADAKVNYRAVIDGTEGGEQVEVVLRDRQGNIVAEASGEQGSLFVKDAHLWEVRSAYLYQIQFRITRGQELMDEYHEEIGIRTVEIKGTQILFNGRPLYLKGFGKHEDSDLNGRGYNPAVIKRDFELMKWIGANSFRTAHYPYSEEIYQMADREGFLIIDEVAAVGFSNIIGQFLPFLAGTGKGSKNFYSAPTIDTLKENHIQAVRDLIARDKNHPSVIAWSLFNEPEVGSEEAGRYFADIFQAALDADPQKRPRTFSMELSCKPQNTECHQYCDFWTINRYYGWYLKNGFEYEDAESALREEMDQWNTLDTVKPMVFTEYGADAYASESTLPAVMWTTDYQEQILAMFHRVFDSYDFICGEQIWNFADFQTMEGVNRVNGNKKGIFTRQRQPKKTAFYLKNRWDR